MTAAEGDEGLVRRIVPLDRGLDFGLESLTGQEGVENAHPVEIKGVGVRGKVLEKVRQSFSGGHLPKLFFPGSDPLTDLFIGFKGMLESGSDMATVDAGHPSSVWIIGPREGGKRLGENSRGIRIPRGFAFFHKLLQSAAENGQDGEGAVGEKEITQGLEPDHDELNRVFPLKGAGVANQGERTAGGEAGVEGLVRFHLPERGFVAGGKAGELVVGTVADAKNDNAGREPAGVPPQGVGFRVKAEVHPEINVGNDRAADLADPRFGGTDLLQGGREVLLRRGGISRIAGAGATGGELGRRGGQALGRKASTAFQSTKLRNSSM